MGAAVSSHIRLCVLPLQDEDGTFRDPAGDAGDPPGPPAAASSGGDTPITPPRTTNQLDDLRQILQQEFPYQAREVEASALLHAAPHPYADTQSNNTLLRVHRQMIRIREMDEILLNAQRQGRISFYMTCRGEEAIHMGAASALELGDPIFAQYREQGFLMWRGFTLEQFCNQCFSNKADLGKGRQMPVHYGS